MNPVSGPERPLGRGRVVLHVNTDERKGGAAQVATNLLRSCRSLGWTSRLAVGRTATDDPSVIGLSPGNRPIASAIWNGAVDKVAGLARAYDEIRGLESFRYPASRRLLEIVPESPDVLHLHNLHGGYFDLRTLPALSHRVPVVLTLHDAWMLSGHCAHSFDCARWETGCGACPDLTIYPAVRRDRTAENWRRKQDLYERCRLYVATPSEWLMGKVERSMLHGGVVDTRVIPNGVDLATFRAVDAAGPRRALGIPPDARVLLFVASGGDRNEFKDHALLLEAIRRVAGRSAGGGLVLLTLGGGPPEGIGGSRQRIDGADLWHLPFRSDAQDVASLYQAADLYVHAAKADTFPNTVLEALACGTPVVATAVGGIPEQIRSLGVGASAGGWPEHGPDDATGVLTPAGDAETLATAILRLLDDPSLRARLARNAAADARDRFALDAQARSYVDWYESILEGWGD